MNVRLYDLLGKHHEEATRLGRYYPRMLDTAQEVYVIPWRQEYGIADLNPDVALKIRELGRQFDEGTISEEFYREQVRKLGTVHTSLTEGIAFPARKEVSFRFADPPFRLMLHELGHIHFGETDPYWGAHYLGGETLVWITLSERGVTATEEQVRFYHTLLHRAEDQPDTLAGEILDTIMPVLLRYPNPPARSLYALMLMAGTIHDDLCRLDAFCADPSDPRLEELPASSKTVVDFLRYMVDGIGHHDPFYTQYGLALGIVSKA